MESVSNSRFGSITLTPKEFDWISKYLYDKTGIKLNDGKQALVMGRLDKRLRARGVDNYSDYFALLGKPGFEDETTAAIDLLTTNETYFFREPKHFDFLKNVVIPKFAAKRKMRVWSAASSSGEEAYSIGMVLAEHFPTKQWEILGTDVSTRVLAKANRGLYPMLQAEKIPREYLKKYCLKGTQEFEDFFLIDSIVKDHISFELTNLVEPLPNYGVFEVIFLRNVMIYFDAATKNSIVKRIIEHLTTDGYLIISHSETLNGLNLPLRLVAPSIYQVVRA